MRKPFYNANISSGFTLMELILVIVLIAVLGSFLIAYIGSAVTRSADPVNQTRNLAAAEAIMERITADYMIHLTVGSDSSWSAFKASCSASASCRTVGSGEGSAYSNNFETIEATVSIGDHILASYFMR